MIGAIPVWTAVTAPIIELPRQLEPEAHG